MECTDPYVIILLQIAIVIFTAFAAFKDSSIRKQEKAGSASATVARGEPSMTALYSMYGATIKVILIVIDFICSTYIYYFSTWFRNTVFFSLKQKVNSD